MRKLKTNKKQVLMFYALTAADIMMILGLFIAIGVIIWNVLL
ncbi:MAG: hypothetical protein ACQESE_04635 [Nanobdellota archaeon]